MRVGEEYGTAVHALGMAGRQTVISTRVWSADSSTVSRAPLYGNVPIYSRKEHRLKMLQASDKVGLYKYRDDLLRYGFPLDVIMQEGKWTKEERPAMFRASLLSGADMWADARERFPRPAPERLPLPDSWTHGQAPGKRLDAALAGARTASAITTRKGLDALIPKGHA